MTFCLHSHFAPSNSTETGRWLPLSAGVSLNRMSLTVRCFGVIHEGTRDEPLKTSVLYREATKSPLHRDSSVSLMHQNSSDLGSRITDPDRSNANPIFASFTSLVACVVSVDFSGKWCMFFDSCRTAHLRWGY